MTEGLLGKVGMWGCGVDDDAWQGLEHGRMDTLGSVTLVPESVIPDLVRVALLIARVQCNRS